jgi:hypothetical protein
VLAYFYYPAFGFDGFRILNISNETTKQFYDETVPCIYQSVAEDSLNIIASAGFPLVHTEEWTTLTDSAGKMKPFQYHIKARSQTGSIDIDCSTLKRPLILADSGFLYQGASGYTYYYSLTMINISGLIGFLSDEDSISGTGWIDHQFGNFNPNSSEDYEWFCIQLDNGMDLNIWNIFTEDNAIPETSAFRICSAYINDSAALTFSDFNVQRLGFKYTQDGERCYSQKWHITADTLDIDLLVAASYSDNEVTLPFRFYEGSTQVSGTVDNLPVEGVGFAELLHSYEKPDITIAYPYSNGLWDDSEPVWWILNNADDGNIVRYNVEIGYGGSGSFKNIASGIKDTAYYWNPSYFTADTLIRLRITGYSADSTLSDTVETKAYINTQPLYYRRCQGDDFSHYISLRAGNEFDYRWQKDNADISGANDSIYILDNLQEEDQGIYRCILSGSNLTDTTVPFRLYIDPSYEMEILITICNNDSVFAGGQWQSLPGIFYDTLSSRYGCDSITITNLFVDICNLIAEKPMAVNVGILANPVTGSLLIEFADNFSGRVEIINSYGQILRTFLIAGSRRAEIDLNGLARGIYFLRLSNEEIIMTRKFILVN